MWHVAREVLRRSLYLFLGAALLHAQRTFCCRVDLRQTVVFHSGHVPCPAQSCLEEHGLSTGDLRLLEERERKKGNIVTLVIVKDEAESALMDAFKELDVPLVPP